MQSPEAASAWALEAAAGLLDVACVDDEQPDTSIPIVTASIPARASAFFTCFPSRHPCDKRGLQDGHNKANGPRDCSREDTEFVNSRRDSSLFALFKAQ
jgi:hypothetical protein